MYWPLLFYISKIFNRKVSGILPVINKRKILLITNKKGNLIFPKGGIKKKELSAEGASREAMEEAGIEGYVEKNPFIQIRGINYHKMVIQTLKNNYLEDSVRTRRLLTPNEALRRNDVPEYVKEVIKKAMNLDYLKEDS